jgi:hypothetical protein
MYNGGIRGKRGGDKYGMVSGRDSFVQNLSPMPSVSSWSATDTSFNNLDDAAVAVGGTVVIYGNGFSTGMTIYLGTTLISSYTLLDSTRIAFVIPSVSFGTYNVLMYYSSGSFASILSPGILVSAFPTWTTGSYTSTTATINIQLLATGDGTLNYYLQAGSSLPSGVTLSSTGLLSGTIPSAAGVTTYTFTVLVDDAQLQTSQQTVNLLVSLNDIYFKNTTLVLNGETTVTPFISDASTNNLGLTIAGDTKPVLFNPYSDGYYSTYNTDTSDSGYGVATNTLLDLGTGDFTIECWALTTALPTTNTFQLSAGGYQTIVSTGPASSTTGSQLYIGITNILFDISSDGAGPINVAHGMVANTWYHIAVTRSSTTFKVFINGVLLQTGTSSASWINGYGYGIMRGEPIGGYAGGWWRGYVSNVRVVKGTALYTATFTPPTTPLIPVSGTSLLVARSNRFIDNSINNFTITQGGTPSQISSVIPFTTKYAIGTQYYSIYYSSTAALYASYTGTAFGTGAFTVEFWFYRQNTGGAVSGYPIYSSATGAFRLQTTTPTNIRMLSSGLTTVSFAVPSMSVDTWYHVVYTRDSSGNATVFLNGTRSSTGVISDTNNYSVVTDKLGAVNYIFLSNIRFVTGSAVYDPTQSTITVPTSPLTAVSGTQLLTGQNNTFKDNSTNNYTITANDAQIVPLSPFTPNGYTNTTATLTYGSAYFDGNLDYLNGGVNSAYNFGSGNFTVEAWVYIISYGSSGSCMAGTWAASGRGWIWISTATTLGFTYSTDGSNLTVTDTTYTVPLNTWTHIAAVRNGNTFTHYVNGVSVGTASMSGVILNASTQPLYIGANKQDVDSSINNYQMNGYIADFRIVKGSAVYTGVFTPPSSLLTTVTNTQLLTLQYSGGANNYGIIDNSNFNNIITRNGNATQGTFSPYSVTGWSNYFDGSGDSLTLTATGATFGTGDFTIECWIYRTSSTVDESIFVQGVSGTGGFGLGVYTQKIRVRTPSIQDNSQLGATTINQGTWYHVALSRSGTTTKLYINGTLDLTITSDSSNETTTSWNIGHYGSNDYVFTGYISNLRVITGTALYTTAFTTPTTPLNVVTKTSLLTCQSNSFIDNSPNNFAITKNADVSVQAYSPFGSIREATPLSYSNYFNGTTDYLTIPYNAAFNLPGDFTIELWFNTTTPTQAADLLGNASSGDNGWGLWLNGSGVINFQTYSSSIKGTTISIVAGTWYHLAVTRTGTTLNMFVNGAVQGSAVTSSGNFSSTSHTLNIGYNPDLHANYFPGYISNVRIVKGAALYTTAFTPSTIQLTTTSQGATVSQVSLLTCQSPTMIDNSTNNFTITAVGSPKIYKYNPFGYTAQNYISYTPSIHGGSMYLDGTGDYLSTFAVNWSTFGSYTLEFWVYHTSMTPSNQAYISTGSTGYTNFYNYADGRIGLGIQGTNEIVATAGSIKINQWQHVVYTYDGTTTKIYVNGVQLASGTTAVYSNNSAALRIGTGLSTQPVFGYMSDVRLTRGTPIYTSNFVPPTQTLTNYSTTYPASLLLNFTNGGIVDQHSSNVLETVGNVQLSTSVKKYGNSSLSFSGSNQYLYSPFSPIWDLRNTYTIEGWIYPTVAAYKNIFTITVTNTGQFAELSVVMNTSTLRFEIRPTTAGTITGVEGGSISLNQWTHFAVSVSNLSAKIFLNGTQVGSTTTVPDYTATMLYVGIGGNGNGYGASTDNWAGYIDDLRITKGFARYTGNFTPSTLPLVTQ